MRSILVGVSEGKRPLGRTGYKWKYNVKIDIGWDDLDWILPALQTCSKPSASPKRPRNFLTCWGTVSVCRWFLTHLVSWCYYACIAWFIFPWGFPRKRNDYLTLSPVMFISCCFWKVCTYSFMQTLCKPCLRWVKFVVILAGPQPCLIQEGRGPGCAYVPSIESESTLGRKSLTHTGVMSYLC